MAKRRTHDFIITMCNPCPICGKQPKGYMEFRDSGSDHWVLVTIQCKPFLRSPHAVVTCSGYDERSALINTLDEWDRRVDDEGKKPCCRKH